MKREEQTVHPKVNVAEKTQKQLKKTDEAEKRAAEQPGKEASVAAELKNRSK
ncbi:MAG TPA: hypothetical protein VG367_04685 [Mucilaginibacter sp.]|jgi:hypothetical protein|nr:hypothetical protein [Mucilaginibacter sp.]